MKSQSVRLLDVFVLGPLMIYVAASRRPTDIVRLALGITGVATIIYNARNYLTLRE